MTSMINSFLQKFSIHTPALLIGFAVATIVIIAAIILLFGKNKTDLEENPFPIRLLSLSFFLTLLAVVWSSVNSIYIQYQMTHTMRTDIEINQMGNQVVYIDTVTASALKRLATTGDPKWADAYKSNVEQLNNTVNALKSAAQNQMSQNKASNVDIYQLAQRIDKNTDFFLQASEQKVLELASANQLNEAQALLNGQEYTERRQDYSEDVHKLAEDTNAVLSQGSASLQNTVSYTLYLGFIIIALLPIAWYSSFRSIRRWRKELENTRKDLLTAKSIAEKAKEAAEKSLHEAEKANAIKSEFLANMSHELRTPLNSILGMLRLLKDAQHTIEENGLVDTALHSSLNLLEIVNDILDLSKIEAGEVLLERIGMDLSYAINSVILTLDHSAKEKHLSLVWQNQSTPPYVIGDPTRIIRVLTNLIGNAIKYTDTGEVSIRTFFDQTDDEHIIFSCEISDTGIGIPEEKQQSIFDKFVQADTSTTRKYGGTGLGLAITKQLVELMGGTIGVRSIVKVGSTFWFKIPLEITDKLNEEKQTRRQKMHSGTLLPQNARILIAEDHPMNQILIQKLMERFHIGMFEIVDNGAKAFKRYCEAKWDVILMDCHMPERNGYDTTADIRKFERKTKAHVPIVAMTANAMVGDREKCLQCGMDEYISKPIPIDELKEVLGQWINLTAYETSEPVIETRNATCIDLSQMRTLTNGDKSMDRELIHLFVRQSESCIQTMLTSQADGAGKAWTEAAHMLKGGAASIGAEELRSLCAKAQLMETVTVAQRVSMYVKINESYVKVKEALHAEGLLD